jgi:hypothetical protein
VTKRCDAPIELVVSGTFQFKRLNDTSAAGRG